MGYSETIRSGRFSSATFTPPASMCVRGYLAACVVGAAIPVAAGLAEVAVAPRPGEGVVAPVGNVVMVPVPDAGVDSASIACPVVSACGVDALGARVDSREPTPVGVAPGLVPQPASSSITSVRQRTIRLDKAFSWLSVPPLSW